MKNLPNNYNDLCRMLFTTVVDPSEYDVEGAMIDAMKTSIKTKSVYIALDIGKVAGLYGAYKKLLDERRNKKGRK